METYKTVLRNYENALLNNYSSKKIMSLAAHALIVVYLSIILRASASLVFENNM